ncbi:HAD family acid phosphatase [Acidobacteriota bacterium]
MIFKAKKKFTVVIDIDGTICTTDRINWDDVDEYPEELEKALLIPRALEVVNELYNMGYRIIFYTARRERARSATERWLKHHGFKYHHLVLDKLVGDVYIDDRSINGFEWKDVIDQIEEIHYPDEDWE